MVFISSLIIGVILYTWGMDSFVYAVMIAIVMEVANVFIFSRVLRRVEGDFATSTGEYQKRYDEQEKRIIVHQQCANCVHLDRPIRCAAFPEEIPREVLTGRFDHRELHPKQETKKRYKPMPKE